MNKAELIAGIAETAGVSKRNAEETLNAMLKVVSDCLASGEPVQLLGFGTFEVKGRNARSGKDFATGERVIIEAKKVPVFKPGSALKNRIAGV